MFLLFLPFSHAADTSSATPPPSAAAPPPSAAASQAEVDALKARLQALEDQLAQQQAEQLLKDAEAMAAPPGPPPPPAVAHASFNAMNPGITAFGDLVAQMGVDGDGVMPGSTLYLRSAELEFRADVDPFAKADAVIAFEQEAPPLDGGPGEGFGAEPEEAYIELVSLPAHLSGRVGKFRQAFGIINRTHTHDLPWVDAPKVLGLLGEEAYNDTGISLGYVQAIGPLGLTLTGAALSGDPFDPEGERANLAGLGRAELFGSFGSFDVGLGGSIIHDIGGAGQIAGGDLTFRWRPDQSHSFFLMAEGIQGEDGAFGGYAAIQFQPARNFYLGVREDLMDAELSHNLSVTYYTSEFLRFRLGGGYTPATSETQALAQMTFVWGSHPVEPWWVNK